MAAYASAALSMMLRFIPFLLGVLYCCCSSALATPLDDYVNKPDPTYKYELIGDPETNDGYTTYYVNLTSQTWLNG